MEMKRLRTGRWLPSKHCLGTLVLRGLLSLAQPGFLGLTLTSCLKAGGYLHVPLE